MKKKLLLIIAFLIILGQGSVSVCVAKTTNTNAVNIAIKKYKAGNYTGCLQDMQNIVGKDPSSAIAYYYIAMSYSQAGRKDKAIAAYQKVLTLKPNTTLFTYASTGKRCLETPDECNPNTESSEMDRMIASPFGDGLSSKVKQDLEQKHLNSIKTKINGKEEEIEEHELRKFRDFTNQKSKSESSTKIAEEKAPSNDEIVAAMKVLSRAGFNPYSQVGASISNPYAQAMVPQNPQAAQMAQMSALLGTNNNQSSNNNAMMNMLPYMLAQKNTQGEANAFNPQIMQAMMMNSMLPDFNFNTDNDK